MILGDDIRELEIESDEDGWTLVLQGEAAEYRLNIHSVAHDLLDQANERIGPWWAEALASLAEANAKNVGDSDEGGYEDGDPKHPQHHLRLVK